MLRFVHRQIIRGLHAIQSHPPLPPNLESCHLDSVQLVTDRTELLRRMPKGGSVMECGVDEGKLSRMILEITTPQKLIMVDTWSSSRFNESKLARIQEKFSGEIANGQLAIQRTTSVDALRQASDGSLDWVYIDTDHSYPTTYEELNVASKKIKPDGYICGHDYVTGSWLSYHRYGVVEAVNRFCVEQNWQFAFLTHEADRHLSFALRAIKSD